MRAARDSGPLQRLTDQVAGFIRRADEGQTGEPELDKLAREVFAFQFENIEPYRNLCRRQGRTPDTVTSWRGIPAVPAQAFKQYTLFAGQPDAVVKTFRSSGTSDAARTSQAHFGAGGLELMDVAVAANARRSLFPDGRRTRILVLAPPPDKAPTMIMVHGMAHIVGLFGLEQSRFVAGPGGVDSRGPVARARRLPQGRHPGVAPGLVVRLRALLRLDGARGAPPRAARG